MARIAIVPGWLAGITLLLAGQPLPLALTAPAATVAGGLAWARWGAGTLAGLRTAVQLKRLLKRAVKIGSAVDHA